MILEVTVLERVARSRVRTLFAGVKLRLYPTFIEHLISYSEDRCCVLAGTSAKNLVYSVLRNLELTAVLERVADCCYEEYRDRQSEHAEKMGAEERDRAEAENGGQDTDHHAGPVSAPPRSLRERMWQAFENPHANVPALVFYYVTGFFIAISVLANIVE